MHFVSERIMLPIGLALVLALGPAPLSAQEEMELTAQDHNIEAYLELLQEDIRTQRAAIVSAMMQFTPEEAEKFWPIYREFSKELAAQSDQKLAAIITPAALPSIPSITLRLIPLKKKTTLAPRAVINQVKQVPKNACMTGERAKNQSTILYSCCIFKHITDETIIDGIVISTPDPGAILPNAVELQIITPIAPFC